MNLLQLKYFIAVCEFGTASGAAEYLHVAQPSVSLAVKELEREFGAQLFSRTHKGMRLTAEGELLLRMGRDIMERTENAEKIMRGVGCNKKTLKLGVPPMIGSLILPTLYKEFLFQNPDISLDITECGKEEMVTKLLDDELDIAFISHNQITDIGLDFLHIDTLEIVCSTSPKNPLARKNILTPKDLEKIPLVMYKDGFFQTSEIKNWFSADHVEPNILIKTNQLSTLIKLISSDTAVGFLFKKLTDVEPDMTSIPLQPPITANISIIWKKQKFQFDAMKSLKSFLKHTNLFV